VREPERERPLLEPPREPAAERRAEVFAAFAPERAPVVAALVVRRAPDAALPAVFRAVLRADVPPVREDELLREREDDVLPERDEVPLRERDVVLRERDDGLLERRLVDERRLRPSVVRCSRGISFLTTSLTSCGISFSR
jgi:hypothetical protein